MLTIYLKFVLRTSSKYEPQYRLFWCGALSPQHKCIAGFDALGSPGTVRGSRQPSLLRVVVLLKNGELEAVECQDQDFFLVARVRDAGICGTFDDRPSATAFIEKLRRQQSGLAGWPSASAEP